MFTRAAAHNTTDSKSHHSSIFGGNGNAATFIQPKLNIGTPGDKYEVQADKAADQIVAKGKESPTSFLTPAPAVQKKADDDIQKKDTLIGLSKDKEGSATQEEIQQKPVVEPIVPGVQLKENPLLQKMNEEEVQTKDTSTSSATEEEEVQTKEEEEAQTKEVEEEVQQKSEEEVQTRKEDEVQTQPETELFQLKEVENKPEPVVEPKPEPKPEIKPILQKQPEEDVQAKEEEEVQEKEEEDTVQKQSTSAGDDGSNIESQLSDSKGGGSPLDSETRGEMESGFGADFGGVRVHNDSNAVQMNQELGSQAFTNGNDIYFNEGKYDPGSDTGKHLLAHELTHTVQQGASPSNTVQQSTIVQKEPAAEPSKPGAPTTVVDLTQGLKLSQDWKDYIEANAKEKSYDVTVKIGSQYQGTISLKKLGKPKEGEEQKFELASKTKKYLDIQGMDFLNPLKESQIFPILVLNNFGDEQATSGFLSVRNGNDPITTNALGIIDSVNKNLESMGFLGIDKINTGGLENKFENGGLNFKANEISVGVDGYIEASGSLGITNSAFTFDVTSTVSVAGLAEGEFNLKRDEKGQLAGKASISADIANVGATLTIEYEEGIVSIQGTGRMNSEKFSGEITLLVTDESKSKQMMHAALGVETMDAEAQAPAAAPVKKTKGNQVLAGWGTVEATITPWLQGTANIGIDNKGQVTIVGTISVPDEIELMEQRGIKHDLFDVEIRAGYGIPLVGQVFLFASIGMFMNAGFGPLVLKDVAFTGTYSTDPSVLQNFSITGTLGINAFAILGLKAEAGVGVTLLGHDVKAGVAVTAAAGIKAYAEATPTFQYQEQKSPEGGKVGESRLKGHFEAAAQLFLQLTGSLFYELDSPWWSPAPDGREDYPLGEVQYPIGESMGIGADVDWLIGSEEPPELKFSPVEFDPDKFTADVMADPPPKKMGKSDQNPKGKFEDKGGGDQQKDPKATGDGKGLPPNSKKEEDLKNLPDDQKYLRGLDELSKLEKADPKPTVAVVEAKMKKVKSKYGLQTVTIKSEKDGEVTVYVKHKKQDNTKNLLKIKTMSEAERKKLLDAAMTDLKKREEKIVDKEGKTEEAKAKDMLTTWSKAHPIIESAKVIDGKTTWDYLLDVGDKDQTEKGKGKTGVENNGEDADEETKKVMQEVLAHKEPFTNVSEEAHNLDFELKGEKLVLFRKSVPTDLREHLVKVRTALNNEKSKTVQSQVSGSLKIMEDIMDQLFTLIKILEDKYFKRTTSKQKVVTDDSMSVTKGKKVKRFMGIMAERLRNIPEIDAKGNFISGTTQARPVSQVDFGSKTKTIKDSNGQDISTTDGTVMNATVLSIVAPSGVSGSQPTPGGHSGLYKELKNNGRDIAAAHLLNHKLFGPGDTPTNLTPIPSKKNNPDMVNKIEKPVKKAVLNDNEVIRYKVTVTYGTMKAYDPNAVTGEVGGIPADSAIATNITADAHILEFDENSGKEQDDPKGWTKDKKGGAIATQPVEIDYTSHLKIKNTNKGKVFFLEKLRQIIDQKLKEKPEVLWDTDKPQMPAVSLASTFKDNMKKLTGQDTYTDTPEFLALKKEFLEKKERLGIVSNTSSDYNEFVKLKNLYIVEVIQEVSGAESGNKSMSKIYAEKVHKFFRISEIRGKKIKPVNSFTVGLSGSTGGWGHTSTLKPYYGEGKEFENRDAVKADLIEKIESKANILFKRMLDKADGNNNKNEDELLKASKDLISTIDSIRSQATSGKVNYKGVHSFTGENLEQQAPVLLTMLEGDFNGIKDDLDANIQSLISKNLLAINERLNDLKTDFQNMIEAIKKEKKRIGDTNSEQALLNLAVKGDDAYLDLVATSFGASVPGNQKKKESLINLIKELKEDAGIQYMSIKIPADRESIDTNTDFTAYVAPLIISFESNVKTKVSNSGELKTAYDLIVKEKLEEAATQAASAATNNQQQDNSNQS